MTFKIRNYKKEHDFSYTFGASLTIEMIKTRPNIVKSVYYRPSYRDSGALLDLCKSFGISAFELEKPFKTLNLKDNCYVLGVFEKYKASLSENDAHVVLVNPSDMGNLGTIIRTVTGMGIGNLALIEPCADIWNPKSVRASMGALFHVSHEVYKSFDDYAARFKGHAMFPFMLGGQFLPEDAPPCQKFSLIFGNEASGLDDSFLNVGQTIRIPMSAGVDSFNLAAAVSIGSYIFARKNKLL